MNPVQAFNKVKVALEQYYRGLPQEQRQVDQAMASLAEIVNEVTTKNEPPQVSSKPFPDKKEGKK